MPASLTALLTMLGRWPRRLAALACLLLAAVSAIAPRHSAAVPGPDHRAGPGERAVPVRLAGIDARTYLHPGDWVDLLVAPAEGSGAAMGTAGVVADRVRVLSVVGPQDGAEGALVVAADRSTALRIAALGARSVLAVGHDPP